jgi:DNA-binding Xre family transcriptional regulator
MAIVYKTDVLKALKEKGYTTHAMRNKELMGDNYIGQRQIQQIRDKEIVSIACLDKLCRLLDCKIEDIIEYIKD